MLFTVFPFDVKGQERSRITELTPESATFIEREFDFIHSQIWPEKGFISLADGIPEPEVITGEAKVYIDEDDGDLKVKFSDGFIATIVNDS